MLRHNRVSSLTMIVVAGVAGCAYTPPQPVESVNQFSKDKVAELHQGMTAQDVTSLFGTPDQTSAGACGQAIGKPWSCVTWTYLNGQMQLGMPEYWTFTFQNTGGQLILNGWEGPPIL